MRDRKIENGQYSQSRGEQMSDIFLPIVKENLMEEFLSEWSKWLVLTNEIVDEKTPGTLMILKFDIELPRVL